MSKIKNVASAIKNVGKAGLISLAMLTADSATAQHATPSMQKAKDESAVRLNDAVTCPPLFSNPVYDETTKAYYAFCDKHNIPTDPKILEYGRSHNIYIADDASLLVDLSLAVKENSLSDIMKWVEKLQSLWYNPVQIAIGVYKIMTSESPDKAMQSLSKEISPTALRYNYATYMDWIFNDPEAWTANNPNFDGQLHLGDEDRVTQLWVPDPATDDVDSVANWVAAHTPQNVMMHVIDWGISDTMSGIYWWVPGWDYQSNSNVQTPDDHGVGMQSVAASRNNDGVGMASARGFPWDKVKHHDVGGGGMVAMGYIYSALDSIYAKSLSNPEAHHVLTCSRSAGNDISLKTRMQNITNVTNLAGQKVNYIIISAGNDAGPMSTWEARSEPYVWAVGGTNSGDPLKAQWYQWPWVGSAYGDSLDFVKDGFGVRQMLVNGTFSYQNGTSPSAQEMGALVAQLLAGFPNATRADIEKAIKKSCFMPANLPTWVHNSTYGWGRPQLGRACKNMVVRFVPTSLNCSNNPAFTFSWTPDGYKDSTIFKNMRVCLPNGQQVPAGNVTWAGNVPTFNIPVSTGWGWTNGAAATNRIKFVFESTSIYPGNPQETTEIYSDIITLSNVGAAPVVPPTPQITTALTPQCDIINITMGNAPAVAGGPITVQTLLNGIPAGTFNYATGLASFPTAGATGPKTATIKYVSAGGITQVDTVINVNTDYPSAISQPTVAPNIVGASPCVGTQYTINNNFTGGGPGVQVRLKRNGAVVAIGVAPFNWTATVGTHTFITEILEGPNACNASWQPGPAATITINANPTPAVSVSPNDTVCNTNPVTMTGLGANLNYSYSPAATNGVPFTPPQSATTAYTVTAQSTITWCSAQIVQNITSLANLPNVAAATPSLSLANVCIGGSASITPNPTNAGNNPTYTWFHGATNLGTSSGIPGTFNLPAIVTATAGTKQLHYVVTYGNSPAPACPPATPTATSGNVALTVHAAPVANVTVSPNDSLCQGNQVTFNVTGWTPSISGGVVNNVPFTPLATNTYSITVTDAFGCTGTATQIITVNQNPSVYITTNPLNATICLGNQATMTANGAISYLRSNGLGTGNPKPVSPVAATTYTVTGTDANGCTNTDTETIIVNGLVNLSGNTWQPIADVCTSANIPFTINIAAGIPAGTVLNVKQEIGGIWTNIGQVTTGVAGPTSVTINASIPMGATAKFTADVANPGQPCAIPGQTDTITVVNNEFPAPVITPNGLHLEIGNLTAGTTQQWQKWDGATFVDMPWAVNPSYNVIANGQYRVESKKWSCVYASNTVVFTNVSVDHVDLEPSIACYPNPLQWSTLFIDNIPLKYHAKAVLHDMAGRTIADEQLTQVNNRAELNLSGVAAGIYILDVYDYKTGDMLKKGVKVVKQ